MVNLVAQDAKGRARGGLVVMIRGRVEEASIEDLRGLRELCTPEDALAIEISTGGGRSHLVPMGSARRLAEDRLVSFRDLLLYTCGWYEEAALSGKRILPWHEGFFSADTDAGNLAIRALCERVLQDSAERGLSPEEARALLEAESNRISGDVDMVDDTVVRDAIASWLSSRGWVGALSNA
jgi:hypothetical protein